MHSDELEGARNEVANSISVELLHALDELRHIGNAGSSAARSTRLYSSRSIALRPSRTDQFERGGWLTHSETPERDERILKIIGLVPRALSMLRSDKSLTGREREGHA